MALTRTQAFLTADGKTFVDEGEAIEHDSLITIRSFFNTAKSKPQLRDLDNEGLVMSDLDGFIEMAKGVKHQQTLFEKRQKSAAERAAKS